MHYMHKPHKYISSMHALSTYIFMIAQCIHHSDGTDACVLIMFVCPFCETEVNISFPKVPILFVFISSVLALAECVHRMQNDFHLPHSMLKSVLRVLRGEMIINAGDFTAGDVICQHRS